MGEEARTASSDPLRRRRSRTGAVIWLQSPHRHLPPIFQLEDSERVTAADCAPRNPRALRQDARVPPREEEPSSLPSSYTSARSSSSNPFPPPPPLSYPTSAPGPRAMAAPWPPALSPGAAHSSTSYSAWRIPMELGSRPPWAPTAPVNPRLSSEGGGPRSASNPRAASSPRRPRTAAYQGWLPHRRPRSPSGCLAWWRRGAGPGDGCGASPAPLCLPPPLSRSL